MIIKSTENAADAASSSQFLRELSPILMRRQKAAESVDTTKAEWSVLQEEPI